MRHNGGLGSLFVVAAALLLAACASIGRPERGPRAMTSPVGACVAIHPSVR